jgi:energy-coupling factor transport system substrate-specific component
MFDAHAITISPVAMLALNASLLAFIGWALWRAEQRLTPASEWLLLALMGVFAVSGRVLLDPIPNVQPVTVIVILTGVHFGASRSIALAASIALVSNMILGHGLWTFYQALGWSAAGIFGAMISSRIYSEGSLNITRLAMASALAAFAFDWIVSISVLHTLSPELLPVYIISGIPFDLLHAAGNVAFVAWLAMPITDLMTRHSQTPSRTALRELASR